jgi:hypothetical protein
MHRWRRSGALGFGAAYDGRFGFDDTENLGGVGARLPTLTLAKVAAPNSVGDARIAADVLKLGLHLKHDVHRGFTRRCRPGRRRRGRSSVLGCGRGWLAR